MDLSLIALLGGCLLLAALLAYVIFVRREHLIVSWGRSGLVTLLFMLIPLVVISLWYQAGAETRLEQIGFTRYPGVVSSSGLAVGLGENPVWVFTVEGDAERALDFYRRAENRRGWALVSEGASLLLFEREGRLLAVSADPDSLIIMMRPAE